MDLILVPYKDVGGHQRLLALTLVNVAEGVILFQFVLLDHILVVLGRALTLRVKDVQVVNRAHSTAAFLHLSHELISELCDVCDLVYLVFEALEAAFI